MKTNQLVTIHDHQTVTSSQAISDHFGKRHNDVLNAIRRISEQCPKEFNQRNFSYISTLDKYGRPLDGVELTRDAFTLVAMSFTGERALQFKLAYIAAFNQMEDALRQQTQAQVYASIDQAHAQEEKLQTQVASLKDELLGVLRTQVKLLGKPKRKSTPNRPMTQNDIAQIHHLHAQGVSTQAIANQLGRSRATVFYTLRGASAQQAPLFAEV